MKFNSLISLTLILLLSLPANSKTTKSQNYDKKQTQYFVDLEVEDAIILEKIAQEQSETNTFFLFSHGRSGELLIDGQWLNAPQIANLISSNSFIQSNTQQLNIYGCEFAKGEKGLEAVAYLESTLNISVSASTNITGTNGDWTLEVGSTISAIQPQNYKHSLQAQLVGSASNTDNANVTSITVNIPTGSVDDLLIAAVSTDELGTQTFTTPTGWTLIQSGLSPDTDASLAVYYRVADGTEGATQTFTVGLSDAMCAAILRYDNVANLLSPIDVSAIASANSSTANPPAVTTTNSLSTIINIAAVDSRETTMTSPTGTDEIINIYTTTNTLGIADEQQSSAGAVDPANWNHGSEEWVSVTLAIYGENRCDPIASGYPDRDGDGISDVCDLDDDNDGILDTDEGFCPPPSLGSIVVNTSTGQIAKYDFDSLKTTILCTAMGGAFDIAMTSDGAYYYLIFSSGSISRVDASNCNATVLGSVGSGTPTGLTILPNGKLLAGMSGGTDRIKLFDPVTATTTVWATTADGVGTSSGDFALANGYLYYASSLGLQRITIDANYNFVSVQTVGPITGTAYGMTISGDCRLVYGGNSDFRVIDNPGDTSLSTIITPGPTGLGAINGLTSIYEQTGCSTCKPRDTDLDGIPDYLDTDSDNDGCPDALEGGDSLNADQFSNTNNTLVGDIFLNGVPKSVDSAAGQGIGTSTDSTIKSDQCKLTGTIIDHNTIYIDSTATGNILLNDQGIDIRITAINNSTIVSTGSTITTAKGGSISIDSSGAYTYTPANGFSGIDTIAYTTCDFTIPVDCIDELLIIEILPLLNPADTASNSIIGNGDKVITYGNTININLLTNDSDPEGDTISFTGIENPASLGTYLNTGTLITIPGIDTSGANVADAGNLTISSTGDVSFTPSSSFVGNITLNYQICDNRTPQACTQEVFKISVLDTLNSIADDNNHPPFANGDFTTTDLNTPTYGNYIANDGDSDEDEALTMNGTTIDPTSAATAIATTATNSGGSVTFYANGTYLYTPPTNFSGTDMVEYEICDTIGTALCTKAYINILVAPVVRDYTDLPIAWGDRYARYLDGPGNTASGTPSYWLGSNITNEDFSNRTANASGDGADDGLIIPTVLDSSTLNIYKVIVNGSQAGIRVHFKLYIDWSSDGIFEDTYTGFGTTDGPDTVNVAVSLPANFSATSVVYRLVAQSSASRLDNTVLNGGEVEDYMIHTATFLPVDLISFDAKKQNEDQALLSWTTSAEFNNDRFEIERRLINEHEFVKIGNVIGAGTSSNINDYTYTDDISGLEGNVCYRLKQVDYNGNFVYSDIECIQVAKPIHVSVYPNPARNNVRIAIAESYKDTEVSLCSVDGKIISSHTSVGSAVDFNVSNLRSGVYYIKIVQGHQKETKRLIITH